MRGEVENENVSGRAVYPNKNRKQNRRDEYDMHDLVSVIVSEYLVMVDAGRRYNLGHTWCCCDLSRCNALLFFLSTYEVVYSH